MSQENVELVREGFARWNQGDYNFFFDRAEAFEAAGLRE